MKINSAIVSAVIVALIGLFGQFVISNRKFIPYIREERAKAYTEFLSACLTGIRAVTITRQLTDDSGRLPTGYSESERTRLDNHLFESMTSYDIEINRSLAYMQIVSPRDFAKMGKEVMESIAGYNQRTVSKEEMDATYARFTDRAHKDLASLKEQSTRLRSMFTNKIIEIDFEAED